MLKIKRYIKLKVFLVEDSLMIRERLHGMVEAIPNIEVIGEEDNEVDAMRSICTLEPDLVVLDLSLASGGGNGMDVLRQIRRRLMPCIVVVLTNYFNPLYQNKCMELGADYFMDKSQELEKLGSLLAKLSAHVQTHKYV